MSPPQGTELDPDPSNSPAATKTSQDHCAEPKSDASIITSTLSSEDASNHSPDQNSSPATSLATPDPRSIASSSASPESPAASAQASGLSSTSHPAAGSSSKADDIMGSALLVAIQAAKQKSSDITRSLLDLVLAVDGSERKLQEELKRSKEEASNVKQERDAALEEAKSLKEQLAVSRDIYRSALLEAEALREELNSMRLEKESATKEVRHLQESLGEATAQNRLTLKENEALNEKLIAATQEKNAAVKDMKRWKDDLDEIISQRNGVEKENEVLSDRIMSMTREDTTAILQAKLEVLEREKEESKQKVEQLKATIAQAQPDGPSDNTAVEELERRLEAVRKELSDERAKRPELMQKAKAKIKAEDDKLIASLKIECAALRKTAKNPGELRKRIECLTLENKKLKDDDDNAASDEYKILEKRYQMYKDKSARLKERIEELEQVVNGGGTIEDTVEFTTALRKEMNKILEKQAAEKNKLLEQVEAERVRREEYQKESTENTKNLIHIYSEVDKYQGLLVECKQEIATLGGMMRESEEMLEASRIEAERQQRESNRWSTLWRGLNLEVESLKERNDTLVKNKTALQKSKNRLCNETASLQSRVNEFEEAAKLREPLVDIGLRIRGRFLARKANSRDNGPAVKGGNDAAHEPNAAADYALFKISAWGNDHESDYLFSNVYGYTPDDYHGADAENMPFDS